MAARIGWLMIVLVLWAATLTGCGGGTKSPELGATLPPDGAALDADAKKLVADVLKSTSLERLCGEKDGAIRDAVRSATVRRMFGPGLRDPRAAGTQAGQYLVERCRSLAAED